MMKITDIVQVMTFGPADEYLEYLYNILVEFVVLLSFYDSADKLKTLMAEIALNDLTVLNAQHIAAV